MQSRANLPHSFYNLPQGSQYSQPYGSQQALPHASQYGSQRSVPPTFGLTSQYASQYNQLEAPGASQDLLKGGVSVYDEAEKDRTGPRGFVCGVSVTPAAYLTCCAMVFEGLFVLLHGDWRVLHVGPFKDSETDWMEFVAVVDIIVALIGALGIWFGHNLLPIGWRSLSKMHSTIATVCSGILLGWRCLVCLSFAPWAGILLAFTPPPKAGLWVFVCCYIAVSILVVYILLLAFRQVVSTSKRFQQHLDTQALGERKQLLVNADMSRRDNFHADGEAMHEHEVEPLVFGFLPLAETVTLYAVIIAIACCVAFSYVVATGHTFGGWAFFAGKPVVTQTYWLEIVVYVLSVCFAVAGFVGAASFTGVGFVREDSATIGVLAFLFAGMARFALLFAVTGMDLIEKDTCGLYVHGLANVAYKSPWSQLRLHCQPVEYLFLLAVIVVCLLDAYLIWATFQLWHHSQEWVFVQPGKGKPSLEGLEDSNQMDVS